MQNKFETLMKTLDYTVSHTNITQDKDLSQYSPKQKFYEISDIISMM